METERCEDSPLSIYQLGSRSVTPFSDWTTDQQDSVLQ
jgi:hypothetical protein